MAAAAAAENQRVLEALQRLALSLKGLPDTTSAPKLSHWRTNIPEALITACDMMDQGTQLIHATSTKYTLVTKIDRMEGSKLAKDILSGCELLGTAALVVHDNSVGSSRSLRKLYKYAVRAVINTCIALLQVMMIIPASGNTDQHVLDQAAPKTGAIWDACDRITKLPRNNRNAMRRDVLNWMMECQDTMKEFAALLQIPISDAATDETTWEMFVSGGPVNDYTTEEQPIAVACLALVKCSRGTINVAMQAMEAVGANAKEAEDEGVDLDWISKLHDRARAVGEGMTDLGTLLYPPLELEELEDEVTAQSSAILELHKLVLENPPVDFAPELVTLSSNIRAACQKRTQEALDGIQNL